MKIVNTLGFVFVSALIIACGSGNNCPAGSVASSDKQSCIPTSSSNPYSSSSYQPSYNTSSGSGYYPSSNQYYPSNTSGGYYPQDNGYNTGYGGGYGYSALKGK